VRIGCTVGATEASAAYASLGERSFFGIAGWRSPGCAHRVQGVTLYRLDNLDVGPGGHRDRAVAQDPLHRCRLHAHREEQAIAERPAQSADSVASRPEWFAAFLADRGTRKLSPHTIQRDRRDFEAIATLITGGQSGDTSWMSMGDITTDTLRTAFANYAKTHEAATIQRCWSTWNVLCAFL
jgi:hypothetical protein